VTSSTRFVVPTAARQLIVVSSPLADPPTHLGTVRTYARASPTSPWRAVFPTWQAEIGAAGLVGVRREGDQATPTGVYSLASMLYGNADDPGGLHEPYHHLVCGDWWDEDPYSAQYNQFVHVACGVTPSFASWSEALWTETTAYPYFAVVDYNVDPVVAGADAPGSGIFLHAVIGGPTAGCVALVRSDLLAVLRWLEPAEHPMIEIGTDAEIGPLPPGLSPRSAAA
jgi:L,D-peptidoglycan transpeptidase YkuD (ErfK/YbiS/YcfS/YnhG family)